MRDFNDVKTLEQALKNLTDLQIIGLVNGFLALLHDRGTDAIDLDNEEYRVDFLRYDNEQDKVFLHFEDTKFKK